MSCAQNLSKELQMESGEEDLLRISQGISAYEKKKTVRSRVVIITDSGSAVTVFKARQGEEESYCFTVEVQEVKP